MTFMEWLSENVATATLDAPQLSHGDGDDWYTDDDDDDGDDDDFEDGPWGWKKMQSLNLALHDWAKKTQYMTPIKNLITQALFSQDPFQEDIEVFPQHVQVSAEWLINIGKWSELDNQIEAILKKSDLWQPLQITQAELWDAVDRGAVYDYMMYVIILRLTGRGLERGASLLDKEAGFKMFEWVREDWQTLEKSIKWDIEAKWEEHNPNLRGQNLNIRLNPGRSFGRPMGLSQATNHAEEIWAKGTVSIPYAIDIPANVTQPFGDTHLV